MPAPVSVMPPSVKFALALPGFDETSAAWQALAERARHLRFFQHPDWYRALFGAALANPDEFVFVTCHEGAQTTGVLPLRLGTTHTLGLPVRTLSLVDHPHASLCSGLFVDNLAGERLMPRILDALQTQATVSWDVLRMDKVPERSPLPGCVPGSAKVPGDSAVQGASAYLDTRSEDAAFGPVSNSFKRELRRRTRKAEEVAPLHHEVHTAPQDLDAALDRWLAIEASGWKAAGGTAIMQDARLVAFYRSLARHFGARGECVIFILRHGDVDVAGQFGLVVNGTLNLLKIAYHEAHSAFAPGNLIMERTLRWCCAQPQVNELSFVTNPPWGHLWKPQHEGVFMHRFFNPTPKGRMLHLALRAKQWNERRRAARATPQVPPEAAGAQGGLTADSALAG